MTDRDRSVDGSSTAPPRSVALRCYDFLVENRTWWLMPIIVVVTLFALLMLIAGSGAAPFIYTFF